MVSFLVFLLREKIISFLWRLYIYMAFLILGNGVVVNSLRYVAEFSLGFRIDAIFWKQLLCLIWLEML